MRPILALALFTVACTSNPPAGGPTYASVHDRLARTPTRLFIGPDGSSGAITARRWTHDGWIDGTTPVTIMNGELTAAADAAGKLEVQTFEVGLDSVDIPESVFNKPAQLKDIRIKLASKPAPSATRWASDDDAATTVTLDLDLLWSIAIDSTVTPLGTQHLPPITIDVALTGAGDHVDSTLALDATGELWSWAGLLQLSELQLALAAATTE